MREVQSLELGVQEVKDTIVCENCKREVPRKKLCEKTGQYNTLKRFCSHKCWRAFNRGKNHCQYTGGRWLDTNKGYWMLTGTGKNARHKPEHIAIAEKSLGRKLKRGEVVHHIDGDKTNNANNNLLICTWEYHQWLHARMSYLYAQEHFGKGKVEKSNG